MESQLNFYGQPIIPADQYDGIHVANPMSAGNPPVCSCGWTRWEYAPGQWFEMADHLRDMSEFSSIPERDRFQYEHILAQIIREARASQREPLAIVEAIREELVKYGTDGYDH